MTIKLSTTIDLEYWLIKNPRWLWQWVSDMLNLTQNLIIVKSGFVIVRIEKNGCENWNKMWFSL